RASRDGVSEVRRRPTVLTCRVGGAMGLEKVHTVPAKHFLQEDQAPALADHIVRLAMASAKSDDAQPS
ncbi:MAG: hypothetical protein AAFN74_17635, partial [Myxococcota bacterium]